QAKVASTDGAVNNLTMSIPGGSFKDFILNPEDGSGSAHVTVVLNDATATFDYDLGNGNNFLTIVASNGEYILSVTVDAAGGFKDLKQPRISGAAAPEPSTIALALVGVAGLGLGGLRRLRRRSPVATA
ncbi:MAG: PEP-CTERM sorting domain-containing protein, partial [Planctomycetes bacterium]|nr:PEP-CTERM sorting domain-containing protein [Planctomycetota bacterium]